eukprot:4545446-Lingulodinium_polyedra.AAC.1
MNTLISPSITSFTALEAITKMHGSNNSFINRFSSMSSNTSVVQKEKSGAAAMTSKLSTGACARPPRSRKGPKGQSTEWALARLPRITGQALSKA